MGIRKLDKLRRDHASEFGGKAANLGELTACGLTVPQGIALDTGDYRAHAERCGLRESLTPLIAAEKWAEAEAMARVVLDAVPLDAELTSAILGAFESMGSRPVSVRSSATGEDASDASFAGQYRTYLDVAGDELLGAVRGCWASLWSARALEYRHRHAMDQFAPGMGVVVQAMVAAEMSGVVFTVDPVDQRSDRMLLEVVEGPGESVVSGTDKGMVYRVRRESFRVVDTEGEGTGLDETRLEKVWRAAGIIEDHFGDPQDVEFGFVGDELWILQTRPITALSPRLVERLEPVRKPTWPERAILPLAAEHYTTAPKPLDNLVFTRLVGGAAEALRRSGGRVRGEDEEAFRTEIWRQAYRLPRHGLTWRAFLAPFQQLRMLEEDWTAQWMAGPEPTLRDLSAPVDLTSLGDEALFQRADDILGVWEELLGERMYVAGAMQAESALKILVTVAVGWVDRRRVLADLARGLDTPVTESNRVLWLLSRRAREHPEVLARVMARAPAGLGDFETGREYLRAVRAFLSAYGHREGSSWYLSTPTWSCDPAQVWSILATLVERDEPPADPAQALASFNLARELVEARLRWVPWLRRRFLTLLKGVRNLTVFREQSHFDLTRPLTALQEIAREWERRLVRRGVLIEEGTVFFLTGEEVRDWILGTPPTPDTVAEIIARRRATYQVVNTRWQEERWSGLPSRDGLKGIPTSPGTARGPVRIVRGEHQFHRLGPGDILVCPYTNPSWTPLFSNAAAVVTEVGGPASHAAIVAREYGIPCVMAVAGATESLRDGDMVVVDGRRGLVRAIEAEP